MNKNVSASFSVCPTEGISMKISEYEFNCESEWGYDYESITVSVSLSTSLWVSLKFLDILQFRKPAFLAEFCCARLSNFMLWILKNRFHIFRLSPSYSKFSIQHDGVQGRCWHMSIYFCQKRLTLTNREGLHKIKPALLLC